MSGNDWFYPIIDVDACGARGVCPREHADRCLQSAPKWMQLRAKFGRDEDHLDLALDLAQRCAAAGTLFVVNDRGKLARAARARAVHLGQHDGLASEAEESTVPLPFGRSTHSLAELSEALKTPCAYVAFGPIFPTNSKQNAQPAVGLERLRAAHVMTTQRGVPLIAIGGIDGGNMASVRGHCEAVALIAALLPAVGEDAGEPFRRLGLADAAHTFS